MIKIKQRKYFFHDNNTLNKGYQNTDYSDDRKVTERILYNNNNNNAIDNKLYRDDCSSLLNAKLLQIKPSIWVYGLVFFLYMLVFYSFIRTVAPIAVRAYILGILTVMILSHLIDILTLYKLRDRIYSSTYNGKMICTKLSNKKIWLETLHFILNRKTIRYLSYIVFTLFSLYHVLDYIFTYDFFIVQCSALVAILSSYFISKYKICKLMMIYYDYCANIKIVTRDSEINLDKQKNIK